MKAQEKIAKILRTDKDFILKIETRLSVLTGKEKVLENIVEENESQIRDRLLNLGVSRKAGAKEIYDALISKIEADDHWVFETLNRPNCNKIDDCKMILDYAEKITALPKGFFIKQEKAKELLFRRPPLKILDYLGYQKIEDLLNNEDVYEIYSAIRLVEDGKWLNDVFLAEYRNLTPDDFEQREIKTLVLGQKWKKAADLFVKKKWHNISHLKELGVVFFIPLVLNISGEILRNLSLIIHYFHEVSFYSDLFKKSAESTTGFSSNIVSLLRGEVFDKRLSENEKVLWLVIQRYLAKDDENDWRLFSPHINSEALHWFKAEKDLVKFGQAHNSFGEEMSFWENLDWVGDYFKDEAGNDDLVSFNLIDTAMSLVQEKELIKYLYHHQEALWNKIFIEYFGIEKLETSLKEYLVKGYFET